MNDMIFLDEEIRFLIEETMTVRDLPIKVDKEIMSGEPVFDGTRVPVAALLDNLEVGVSLDEFLENFPTVKREQAVQVLEYFKTTLDDIKKAA